MAGSGWPLAGVIPSVSGNRPSLPATNDPLSEALDDGVPVGGAAVALNELPSAFPEIAETPSERICLENTPEPSAVAAEKLPAYLPFRAEAEIGLDNVCCQATPAPEEPLVPSAPPSSSMR